jgi:MFS family permease
MNKKPVLLFTAFAHSLDHSYIIVFTILLPLLVDEFDMSPGEIGLIASVPSLLFGFNAIPAGFLTDRIGSKKIAALSISLCGVGALLIGTAWNILALALFLVILGVGAGLYHPAGISLVSKTFEKNRSKAMGIHGIGGNVGQTLTPIITGILASPEIVPLLGISLIGLGLGWRITYMIWAVPGLVVAACILMFIKVKEEPVKEEPFKKMLVEMIKIPFENKNVGVLLVLASFQGLYFNGLVYFLPIILKEVKFLPLLAAAFIISLKEATGIMGQAFGGWSGDKYKKRTLLISFNVVSALAMGWFFFAESPFLVAVPIAVVGVSKYAFQPVQNSLIAESIPTALRGRAYGLTFFASYGIGGLAPLFSGILAEYVSLSAVIPLLIVFAVVSALIATQIQKE